MTDYGHELMFGSFLTPSNLHPSHVVELAQLTNDVGLDLVTFQDHPYQSKFLDIWTLLSYVAFATDVAPQVRELVAAELAGGDQGD